MEGLDPVSIVGGSYCLEDGYMGEPQAAIAAMGRRVDVRIATVESIAPTVGAWLLETSAGRFSAPALVIAAGADTRDLVAPLGVDLLIEREPRHLFLSAPIRERLLEPLVVSPERRFAAKQLHGGRVLASDLGATGTPEAGAAGWRRNVRAVIAELPRARVHRPRRDRQRRLRRHPDRQPILGAIDGHDRLSHAAGLQRPRVHDRPAVGRIVAGAVVGDDDTVLAILDSRRFQEGRTVPEPQVI